MIPYLLQNQRDTFRDALNAIDSGERDGDLDEAMQEAWAIAPEVTGFDRAEKTALTLRMLDRLRARLAQDDGPAKEALKLRLEETLAHLKRLSLSLCAQDIAGFDAAPARPGLLQALSETIGGLPAPVDPELKSWAAIHLGLPYKGTLPFSTSSTQQLASVCLSFHELLRARGQTSEDDLRPTPYAVSMWSLVAEPIVVMLSGEGGEKARLFAGHRRGLMLSASWFGATACAEAWETAPDDLPADELESLLHQGQVLCDLNETLLREREDDPMTNLNMALRALLSLRARLYLIAGGAGDPKAAAMAAGLYAFLDDDAGVEAARGMVVSPELSPAPAEAPISA